MERTTIKKKRVLIFRKYAVLLGILISLTLLANAIRLYPGGSLYDKNTVGFNWTENFISNLFSTKAINGAENPSRLWADAGMMFLSISFTIFFINFSKKIPAKGAAQIIKFFGASGMLFTILIVTPLHDIMVTIASTLFLVSLFYITVFIIKSRLHFFKIFCVLCMLIFYYTLWLYGTGSFKWLPLMQKITFASVVLLILLLEYFTEQEDFFPIPASQIKDGEKHV